MGRVNFDESANGHFVKDYGLHSQAVVLSARTGGKQVRWKNLDRIWKLVGDKGAFQAYITDEVRTFYGAW